LSDLQMKKVIPIVDFVSKCNAISIRASAYVTLQFTKLYYN
jgi:hypothetical protein